MLKDLEKELKRWREKRSQTPRGARPQPAATATDRRTVHVNGQEVVVVKKSRKAIA
ncbi:MAG: hypothetical protein ACRD2A_15250 [Vicinamibacterales bacterium]